MAKISETKPQFPIPKDLRIEKMMGYHTSDLDIRRNILNHCGKEHMRYWSYKYAGYRPLCQGCWNQLKEPLSRICADFSGGEQIYNEIVAETEATKVAF